ncbi:selenoprotein S [Misgurnus anguillicaudatus]|uniref:selenoprotein S n=1 Tax=Misgurnus anguillicaudatus TaxID=75329 RepID=UPI0024350787|nr:selenoprotein S [Misgurnus anguillicaudatus]
MEADDAANVRNEGVLPQNQDLNVVVTPVTQILSDYGWYLLFLCVGVYLLIQHLNKKRYIQNQSQSVTVVNQDPVSVVRRQEALEASRQRMQEELNAKAEEFKERQKMIEEEKRKQKMLYKGKAKVAQNTEEATSSTVLKPKTDKKLRSGGYNPLAGDGGGTCSWRPGRRGPSAGG